MNCYKFLYFRIFSHPNVLPVLGAVNESGSLVILSQYMPYGSLYNVLHEGSGKLISEPMTQWPQI